jgi:hypothetical protein
VTGDHAPATVDPATVRSLARGTPVTMLGFGDGLPLKIDTGGVVVSTGGSLFQATVDAFAGNSGSGVFVGRSLVGMLSSGAPDFTLDELGLLPRQRAPRRPGGPGGGGDPRHGRVAVGAYGQEVPRRASIGMAALLAAALFGTPPLAFGQAAPEQAPCPEWAEREGAGRRVRRPPLRDGSRLRRGRGLRLGAPLRSRRDR